MASKLARKIISMSRKNPGMPQSAIAEKLGCSPGRVSAVLIEEREKVSQKVVRPIEQAQAAPKTPITYGEVPPGLAMSLDKFNSIVDKAFEAGARAVLYSFDEMSDIDHEKVRAKVLPFWKQLQDQVQNIL